MVRASNEETETSDLETPLLPPPPSLTEEFGVTETGLAEEEGDEPLLQSPLDAGGFVPQPPPHDVELFQGELQAPRYRDVWFAVLFYMQLGVMLVAACVFAPYLNGPAPDPDHTNSTALSLLFLRNDNATDAPTPTMAPTAAPGPNNDDDDDGHHDHSSPYYARLCLQLLTVLIIVWGAAVLSCGLWLRAMQKYSTRAVLISFALTPLSVALSTVLLLAAQEWQAAVYFALALAVVTVVAAIHYLCLRRYVPFTAANLQVAVQALQVNRGLFLSAFLLQCALVLYLVLAITTLLGLAGWYQTHDHDQSLPVWVVILWTLAVFWTCAVLQNILRTATAGAVGGWWFGSNDGETKDALYRALTYSFGSICLGSLILAVVQVLETLTRSVQRHDRHQQRRRTPSWETQLLCCVLECILQWLDTLLQYFNSWAFIYVGLYGYSYTEAGINCITLFKTRGWTFLLTDRLTNGVLMYGRTFCGSLSAILAAVGTSFFIHRDYWWFVLLGGFLTGYALAVIVSHTMESAVRTVIVCFAEHPNEGVLYRATECQILADGWSATYPTQWQWPTNSSSGETVPTSSNAQSSPPPAISPDTEIRGEQA